MVGTFEGACQVLLLSPEKWYCDQVWVGCAAGLVVGVTGVLEKDSLFLLLLSCSGMSIVTPWTAARQASLSFPSPGIGPNSRPLSWPCCLNHLILCCPLLLLPSVFPSLRVFSSESALCVRWPKYWSFNFSISPSSVNVHG